MSDSRNLTEVTATVAVTQFDENGTIPPNEPPTAHSQSITLPRATATPVVLTGSDPDGDALTFTIITAPAHGTLTGDPPEMVYTPDPFFTGDDSLVFRVMDPGGLTSSATISFTLLQRAAQIVVYEPFDYTPVNDAVAGRLAGRNGGIGWSGPWADNTTGSNGGEAFIYDSQGNAEGLYNGNFGNGLPGWDGQVNNLPNRGGYAGLSDWSSQAAGNDRLNSHRQLARSAGEMAAENNGVLWLSAVWHLPDPSFHSSVGIALTSGGSYFVERARTLTNSGNGIGVGHGANLTGGGLLNPLFWHGGVQSTPHPDPNTNPVVSSSADNIVILKFEFSASEDTVHAWFFNENQEMTEAAFLANAVSATSSIDAHTLDTLTFSTIRHGNAVDEIRIAHSFHDVISGLTDTAPAAHSQALSLPQNTNLPVTLTGDDPRGGGLTFAITRPPSHGALSGQLPNLTYTPDVNFHGIDRLTFSVTDAGQHLAEAEVTLHVIYDPPPFPAARQRRGDHLFRRLLHPHLHRWQR